MIELPLVFTAGVLGSSHCIGMCGPFAVALGGGARSWRENAARQAIYTAGRVFTYSSFGALAGFAGWRLGRGVPLLQNVAAALAIVAGVLLVYFGLQAVGVIRRRAVEAGSGFCFARSGFASLLRSPGWSGVFVAGLITGLLPCGLVYGFVALAASTRDVASGALLMAVFGLGTAPVMMLTGSGASLLSMAGRRRLYQAAAWCLVATGALSIARGVSHIDLPGKAEAIGCPACLSREADESDSSEIVHSHPAVGVAPSREDSAVGDE